MVHFTKRDKQKMLDYLFGGRRQRKRYENRQTKLRKMLVRNISKG